MKTRNNLGENTKNMHEMRRRRRRKTITEQLLRLLKGPLCVASSGTRHTSACLTPSQHPHGHLMLQPVHKEGNRGTGWGQWTQPRSGSRAPSLKHLPRRPPSASQMLHQKAGPCAALTHHKLCAMGHCAMSENTVFPQEPSKIAGKRLSSFKRPRF